MRIKLLLLVGILGVSSSLMAQTVVFYNKGLMSVKSTGVNVADPKTTLYIKGDFVAGRDATDADVRSQIYLEGSQTVLTGNFIHELNAAATSDVSSNVFVLPASYSSTSASRFVFRGTSAQSIGTTQAYSALLKGENYINFPDIVIENTNHVTLAPELAASAQNLNFKNGRLILDSRRLTDSDEVVGTMHNAANSSMLAHFMVESTGTITNNNATLVSSATDPNVFGAVQVNLAVDNPLDYTNGTRDEKLGRSLIAMGSPYAEMKADYFFWNFLMIPKGESLIGGNTMTDPQRVLKAGEGFVIGVDLRGTDPVNYVNDLSDTYKEKGIKFSDRGGAGAISDVTGQPLDNGAYYFSRFGPFFSRSTNIFQATFANSSPANTFTRADITNSAYAKETLNYTDIPTTLVQGYNYFANPYTAPLGMGDIIASTAGTEWGVMPGNSSVTDRDIANRVWILDPDSKGSGTYNILDPSAVGPGSTPGNKWVVVNAKYRVMRPDGNTAGVDYESGASATNGGVAVSDYSIAPLQMFVLFAPKAGNITIPASKRRISENALFVRSAPTNSYKVKDDFLFHVLDETTQSADRTAIVIRTPQDIMTDTEYAGTKKLLTLISTDGSTTRSTVEEGSITQTNMSTIYTKDEQGIALESNILGVPQSAQTESVVLYLTPSLTGQNISINASRLSTADRVLGITLIDKVLNKEFDLFSGKSYATTSKAADPIDRFSVRFTFGTSGIEDGGNSSESKNITSYYANGTLTVAGFEDSDIGSLIHVFDIQGRKVAQAKVNDISVNINQAFFAGAYIVKVVGNKSYAAKFLVK